MAVTDAHDDANTQQADQLLQRLDRVPISRYHTRVIGTLGAGTFFDAFDIVSIATVLSAISTTYHLNSSQAGLLVSAGFLGQAIGALGFGVVSERLGRRRVFIAALVVMGVFGLVSALSWSSTSLGAFRLVQGFGLGAEVPVASALLGEFVSARNRGQVTVLYKLASPLGNLATSLTAAAILAATTPQNAWRLLFAIGGVPILIAIVAWWVLPESPRVLIRHGRLADAERIVSAMEAAAAPATDGGVGKGVGKPVELNDSTAIVDLQPTRHAELLSPQYRRRTLTAWVLWFSVYFTLLGGTSWMPSLYVKKAHVTASTASLLNGVVTVAAIILIIVAGATVDRVGRRRWFVIGFAVSLLGAVLALALGETGNLDTWPLFLVSGGVMLLGVSIIDPLVYAYTAEIYPTRMRAWGALSASAWRAIAVVIAPTIIGHLVENGIVSVFALFTAVLLVGGAVTARFCVETTRIPLEELSR